MQGITIGALNIESSKAMHLSSGIKMTMCNRKNRLRERLQSSVIISTHMKSLK